MAKLREPGSRPTNMNSFEFNKIAGALLATALVVFGLNQAKSMIYHAEKPDKQGYAIEVAATGSGTCFSLLTFFRLMTPAIPTLLTQWLY